MSDIDAEYKWISSQNLKKFTGKWIAVHGKQILSSGKYADKVADDARKKSGTMPFLVKVPEDGYISV
ncbi:MAG: DUF5678 domain-containing protein [Candidatus Thermoplasmatota archaeon]|nr:DUF5678 domain-containing protein [Candidatus Thermoplasmatota archaeon]